jgi:hypothetical protein
VRLRRVPQYEWLRYWGWCSLRLFPWALRLGRLRQRASHLLTGFFSRALCVAED